MLEWLENSILATYLKTSDLLYPLVESAHIIGFVVMVGAAFMFDLRLLGFSKQVSIAQMGEHLLPWCKRGFAIVLPTGLLLFISNAEELFYNKVFIIKIILIIIALLNAAIFHLFTYHTIKNNFNPTPYTKTSAVLSLILWTAVLFCGRLIAYL
jgi:hypothetical protein